MLSLQKLQFGTLSSSYFRNHLLDIGSYCGCGISRKDRQLYVFPSTVFLIFHLSRLLAVLFTGILGINLGSCSRFGLVDTLGAAGGECSSIGQEAPSFVVAHSLRTAFVDVSIVGA